MSNGHACCILGICCPPAAQEAALAGKIAAWTKASPKGGAERYLAAYLLSEFDLAPKGATQAVLDGWPSPPIARAQVIGEKLVDIYAAAFAERDQAG